MPVKVFLQPCSVYIFMRLTSKQQKQKLFLKYTELHWLGYGKTSNSFSRSALHLYYCDISHPQSEVPKRQALERRASMYLPLLCLGFPPPWTWSWGWQGLCRCRCRWCSPPSLPLSFRWPRMMTRSWGPERDKKQTDKKGWRQKQAEKYPKAIGVCCPDVK